MLDAMGIVSISNDIYLVEYDFTAAFASLFIRFIAGSNDNEIQFPFALPATASTSLRPIHLYSCNASKRFSSITILYQ